MTSVKDKKQIETGVLQRSFQIRSDTIDEEKRTVEISFSSEEPYERWFGVEILDHRKKAIRLERLNDGGALLADHNPYQQIGVVEKAWVQDNKGRAKVRFSKNEKADEYFRDVLDGIRSKVSVGYIVHKMRLEEDDEGVETFRVTDWEPLEVSLVAVPADATVGVGRSESELKHKTIIEGDDDMSPVKDPVKTTQNKEHETGNEPNVDVKEVEERARRDEMSRVKEIMSIGRKFDKMEAAEQFVSDGRSVEEFKDKVLQSIGAEPVGTKTADIGLTKKEVKQYSFLRLIRALANPTDKKAQEAAGYELECSQAVADEMRSAPEGAYIPYDVLSRDLTVGGTGSNVVDTSLMTGSFIDMLMNRLAIKQAGAQVLGGLVGDIAVPKQTGGATAYWVGEGIDVTESTPALGQVGLTPKTIGAFTDLTRKFIKQSSIDAEAFVRRDLARTLALGIDLAAISGDGASDNPTGILNTSGISLIVGGTDGAAPTWSHIVEHWQKVAVDNADIGSLAFLTNAKVVGKLMTTEKASGTGQFVCPGFPDANGITNFGGMRTLTSNQVPSNLDKGTSTGVCSAIIFGNFSDLLMGQWGTLDINVDASSLSTSGGLRVVALQDVDVAVRHAESFAAMKDALTS